MELIPRFPPQEMSSVIGSLVSAGHDCSRLIKAAEFVVRRRFSEFNPQSLAMLVWAAAVNGVYDLEIFQRVMQIDWSSFSSGITSATRRQLSLALVAYQWESPTRYSHPLPVLPFAPLVSSPPQSDSLLHHQVSECLSEMRVPHENEFTITPGLVVDIAIKSHRLAIEVNGPFHYLFGRNGEMMLDGSTKFKSRILKKMGWKGVESLQVVNIRCSRNTFIK